MNIWVCDSNTLFILLVSVLDLVNDQRNTCSDSSILAFNDSDPLPDSNIICQI